MDPFRTPLCDLLGIRYPILQGAMARVGGPRLAAAVSNAGGLGFLATWGTSAKELRRQIRETRELTDKPFGVNITPISYGFARSRAEIILEEGVGIVSTGRADPGVAIVSFLKQHGVKVIGVVPTVRHALRLEAEGVDVIVASGCEGGGHVGSISSLPLIPRVVDAVKVPVVAAGGIADARGFVAALALGAQGIQMGTRFIATPESEANEIQKKTILRATEEDTVVTELLTGRTSRYIKGEELKELLRALEEGNTEEARRMTIELRRRKSMRDKELSIIGAGQAVGLINSIIPAEEIIRGIIEEAREICRRLGILSHLI